jgi:hypothetical protein
MFEIGYPSQVNAAHLGWKRARTSKRQTALPHIGTIIAARLARAKGKALRAQIAHLLA